jgi:hypothetical protein
MNLFLGLDLGQARDYTAIAVVERLADRPFEHQPEEAPRSHRRYHLRHLERCKLGTSYPDVVGRVKTLLRTDELRNKTWLVADATGVGRPVVDLLRQAGLRPEAVTVHGGGQLTRDPVTNFLSVPKRELVSAAQVLLQSDRLKFAAGLPEVKKLVSELLSFEVKITEGGHDTYGAWREGAHDDLVFAVALAAWYAEWFGRPAPRVQQIEFRGF